MSNICDVALSCWRLEKWINNLQVNRKTSALNSVRRIREYLSSEGVEIIDFTGRQFDDSFPINVVNEDDITDDCVIIEMTKPVIVSKNGCALRGEVYVGEHEDILIKETTASIETQGKKLNKKKKGKKSMKHKKVKRKKVKK